MTTPERARELVALLALVQTNRQARGVAQATAAQGDAAVAKLAGFTSAGARGLIAADVERLRATLDLIPDDEAPPLENWTGPTGLRTRIQAVAAGVWAQERAFPDGTSYADDWSRFSDGFVDGLRSGLGVVEGIAGAVTPLVWPLVAAAVAVLVIVVVVKTKVGA